MLSKHFTTPSQFIEMRISERDEKKKAFTVLLHKLKDKDDGKLGFLPGMIKQVLTMIQCKSCSM